MSKSHSSGKKKTSREMRRRRRACMVWLERGMIAFWIIALAGGIGTAVYLNVPGLKLNRQLHKAESLMEISDYDGAIAHYQEALNIDSTSVKAYQAMAGAYWNKEDKNSAELTLQQGFEATQDDELLQEYCIYMLNDAVADINAQSCTFETLEKCLTVLETSADNTEVYSPLDACYEWLIHTEDDDLFTSLSEGETYFEQYVKALQRMIRVYQQSPSDSLKNEIVKYATIDRDLLWLDVPKLTEYQELLASVQTIGTNDSINSLSACLEKAAWAQEYFATAFTIFESGEYAPIRDFIQEDTYISLRDQFMAGATEYWSGQTYIPISREKMKLMNADGAWTFAFADFEEYPQTKGVVNLWAAIQQDDGVQRICISYEPEAVQEDYYPHTTFEFIYLYSNVKINGELVPKMNYRFETRVATKEGTTTQLIGDWGGANEWTTTF